MSLRNLSFLLSVRLKISFYYVIMVSLRCHRLMKTMFTTSCANDLRGVLFIVRAGDDIIKAEFIHTKRTNCLTKMKIGIHLEELK